MKAILVFLLAFLAVGGFGASLYDEKAEVKKEVEAKYNDAIAFADKVKGKAEAEKSKKEEAAEKETQDEAKKQSDDANTVFKKLVIDTTRSAIARGKPALAIECIAKVSQDGNKLLNNTITDVNKAVSDIKINKEKGLDLMLLQIELIKSATEGLKAESVKKIEADLGPNLKALKADGLKKAQTAGKQLQDIEKRIPKPDLTEEYRNIRQKIEGKFKEVLNSLIARLQKCIS